MVFAGDEQKDDIRIVYPTPITEKIAQKMGIRVKNIAPKNSADKAPKAADRYHGE